MIITAGKFKGLKVEAPDSKTTRPTLSQVRMSVFNTLQSMIDFEGSFLDMFAGSGIMGLEALSRGFESIVEIENDSQVYSVLKNNYKKFMNEDTKLFKSDSLRFVKKLDKKFNVIYIDPPYFSGVYEESLNSIKNITGGIVILEHVTDVDFTGYKLIKQKKYGKKFVSFLILE
ncbi:MAG: 16S rRNA (guanine(966)-N(2))-methyltransferase RsmD [Clostridiaceae bacterium]|jgi:16S rRNA (guanine966-N2)-methyltransferase|nr:16S rRNA (guanine(966)-N(2))-methyltransferase RsmD [Clostridiaceae bacterium]